MYEGQMGSGIGQAGCTAVHAGTEKNQSWEEAAGVTPTTLG